MIASAALILAATRGESPPPAGTVAVPLSRGLFAIVDEADCPLVANLAWHAHQSGHARENWYAVHSEWSGGRGRSNTRMHRLILGAPPRTDVDHVDGNGLNNQRRNIRICTRSLNLANSRRPVGVSGYRGVMADRSRWGARAIRWKAVISVSNYPRYLGSFDDKIDAARAYDAAAIKLFGEFATLNFPAEHGRLAA